MASSDCVRGVLSYNYCTIVRFSEHGFPRKFPISYTKQKKKRFAVIFEFVKFVSIYIFLWKIQKTSTQIPIITTTQLTVSYVCS